MQCFSEELNRNDEPSGLPPVCCYRRHKCTYHPATSTDIRIEKETIKYPDCHMPSPNSLYVLSKDVDSNSVGFVDIEELRALEGEDRVSIATLPCAPKSVERKPFLSLRKWIRRQRSGRCGYENLAITMKHSIRNRYLEIYHSKTTPTFLDSASASSVVLPLPPQKPSLSRTIQRFLPCCGT